MPTSKVNLQDKLALFDTHWDPKVVATYNDNDVMVAKIQGEYDFHKHDATDDFFLVIEGQVTMDYKDHESVTFGPGEIVIVPAGIVHRPRAEHEATILMIEPKGEPSSGDSDRPAAAKDSI